MSAGYKFPRHKTQSYVCRSKADRTLEKKFKWKLSKLSRPASLRNGARAPALVG
jgi:hypothetical protein